MKLNTIYFLLTLKNASMNRSESVKVKLNNTHLEILSKLYEFGFIQSYKIIKENNFFVVVVMLRYAFNKSFLNNIKIISKPSKECYMSLKNIYNISDKKLFMFLSTNKGILNSLDCKKQNVGGKALFVIL